jgi:hypothetical protein
MARFGHLRLAVAIWRLAEASGVAGSDGWNVEILPRPLFDSTMVKPLSYLDHFFTM